MQCIERLMIAKCKIIQNNISSIMIGFRFSKSSDYSFLFFFSYVLHFLNYIFVNIHITYTITVFINA